jgi:hypothetical protein
LIAIFSNKDNYEYSFCRGVFEDGQKNYVQILAEIEAKKEE